jgi:hypothetical protein
MSTKRASKTKAEPRRAIVDQVLAANVEALREAPGLTPGAAELARQILALVADRPAKLTTEETHLGTTAAAVLTAFSCGMPRADFVARLRGMANAIEAEGPVTELHALRALARRAKT